MKYNDLWFRIIAALLAAHFIVIYGVKDSFFDLLFDPIYYEALFGSFVIALILIQVVYLATKYLDRKYDWQHRTIERVGLQFLGGFAAPGLLAFFLAFIYFAAVHVSILKTPYLRFDYPIILVLLLMLNVYYLAYYFFLKWQIAEREATGQTNLTGLSANTENKPVFIVSQGAKNIPIQLDDIAYFFRDKINMLRTFDGRDFIIAQSLDDVEDEIMGFYFFRANRQFLVNKRACTHFELLPYNKLQLFIIPKYKDAIVVSQKRNREFRNWLAM